MQKYLVLVPKTTQRNYSNLLYIPVILQEHTKIPRDFTIKKLFIHISNNHIKHTLEKIKSIDERHHDNENNNDGKHYRNTTILEREKERERDERGDNTGQGVVQESCSQGLYHTTSLSWLINSKGLPGSGVLVLVV